MQPPQNTIFCYDVLHVSTELVVLFGESIELGIANQLIL